MKDSIKPTITVGRSDAHLADQGYSYNQSGLTYNSPVSYGGIYGYDISPTIARSLTEKSNIKVNVIRPGLFVSRTNAQMANQGYSYDNAGITYNSSILYGGIYEHDIYPLVMSARQEKPTITLGNDFGATVIPTPPVPGDNSGMLIGMLGMLYP